MTMTETSIPTTVETEAVASIALNGSHVAAAYAAALAGVNVSSSGREGLRAVFVTVGEGTVTFLGTDAYRIHTATIPATFYGDVPVGTRGVLAASKNDATALKQASKRHGSFTITFPGVVPGAHVAGAVRETLLLEIDAGSGVYARALQPVDMPGFDSFLDGVETGPVTAVSYNPGFVAAVCDAADKFDRAVTRRRNNVQASPVTLSSKVQTGSWSTPDVAPLYVDLTSGPCTFRAVLMPVRQPA